MTQEIIPKQFDRSLWAELQNAADTWRLPYWDWAMQKPDWHDKTNRSKLGPNVPEVVTLPKVPVRGRTGGMVFMDNPMWKFKLQGGDNMGNHGIPFLEGEPVSDADWRSIRILLSFGSSRIPKPLSGGRWLISPATEILRQSLSKVPIRASTPSLAAFVATVTIPAILFPRPCIA